LIPLNFSTIEARGRFCFTASKCAACAASICFAPVENEERVVSCFEGEVISLPPSLPPSLPTWCSSRHALLQALFILFCVDCTRQNTLRGRKTKFLSEEKGVGFSGGETELEGGGRERGREGGLGGE